MGRPPMLTEDMKEYIFGLKTDNPAMTAKDVIESVKEHLIANYPNPTDFTEREIESLVRDELLPESAITKYVTELNKKYKAPAELDKPWSMAILDDYPQLFPPGVLPSVLDIYRYAIEIGNIFTIRQAKWVARLSGFFKDKDSKVLWFWALRYAGAEYLAHMTGGSFNTEKLDTALMGLPSPDERDPEYQQWKAEQYKKALSQMAARGGSQVTGEIPKSKERMKEAENEGLNQTEDQE
jgi:hypothetical protein